MSKPLCVIAGVGPGNGLAFYNRFAREGYRVALLARSFERLQEYAKGREDVYSFACDLSDPDAIQETFAEIEAGLGLADVVIYNAGSGVFGSAMETRLDDFEDAWKINALGLLSVTRAVAPAMAERGSGSILVTGATASLRGGANFAAFSSAKAAQRNLAQSLARSLGPQGVHVALVIIDGIIDMPRTRAMLPDMPDSHYMQPDDIAEAYYHLSQQKPSAWTFELDLRSCNEKW